MATTNFEDFYEVPNLNFDILKLRDDLYKILEKKNLTPRVLHILELYQLIKYQMTRILLREIVLGENIGLSQMIVEKKFQEI